MNDHPPSTVWSALLAGNARFAAGSPERPRATPSHLQSLRDAQHPQAIVFSCADSRVPAEIVFDQGLGDLFVVRTAGHVVDDAVLGTIEFGVAALQIPLLVVLGHRSCGAVGAAVAAAGSGTRPEGHIGVLVDQIAPSVSGPEQTTDQVARAHVAATLDLLRHRSPVLAEAAGDGGLALAGAVYDLADGTVDPVVTPRS